MNEQYRQSFSRNLGIFSESEQERIRCSTVAIAGLGGVGGLAAERLLRLGVGTLKITDPGAFELSNLNRQFCSGTDNIGHNKTEELLRGLKMINPEARIYHSTTGIRSADDAASFVAGSDVVIDAMDFGMFAQSIELQRAARHNGAYYLFSAAIGFGALAVVFEPAGLTLEEYDGLEPDIDLSNHDRIDIPVQAILPCVPTYARDRTLIARAVAGEIPVPTNSIGAGLAAVLAASEAVNLLVGRGGPRAPEYTYFDLVDRKAIVGVMPTRQRNTGKLTSSY